MSEHFYTFQEKCHTAINLTVSVKNSEDFLLVVVVVKILHLLRALTSSMHVFMAKMFKRNVSVLNQSFIKTLRFQEMNLSDFHSQSRRHRLQNIDFPCWSPLSEP